MNIISSNIKWIMLISGAVTCTMFYAIVAPESALMNMFGVSLNGPVAAVVVRSWGFLITLMGIMLIVGALNPIHRDFSLVIAGSSKIMFIALVLILGRQYLPRAGLAIAFDSLVVVLYFTYLARAKTASIK